MGSKKLIYILNTVIILCHFLALYFVKFFGLSNTEILKLLPICLSSLISILIVFNTAIFYKRKEFVSWNFKVNYESWKIIVELKIHNFTQYVIEVTSVACDYRNCDFPRTSIKDFTSSTIPITLYPPLQGENPTIDSLLPFVSKRLLRLKIYYEVDALNKLGCKTLKFANPKFVKHARLKLYFHKIIFFFGGSR